MTDKEILRVRLWLYNQQLISAKGAKYIKHLRDRIKEIKAQINE